ncbi:unnamed protein product [Spodoptera exigua]|nr:unnamed protein product [Spodoptera exigua]
MRTHDLKYKLQLIRHEVTSSFVQKKNIEKQFIVSAFFNDAICQRNFLILGFFFKGKKHGVILTKLFFKCKTIERFNY